MTKPFDASKFRKGITKSIDGIAAGFYDPKIWVSTGSYALNYLISGDFRKGVPMGKVTTLAGESGCLPENAKVTVRLRPKDDNVQEREVTVGELRELYHSGKWDIEIDTPDGFQPLGRWYDKGKLGMVRITTDNHSTDCAVNHLIQDHEDLWVQASELEPGYSIQTKSGIEAVREVATLPDAECYDFEVLHPNHRYYGDGIVSHNSGKSFICSGNLVRNAQQQGIFVVLLDSENALDEKWLHAIGVDTSEDKLLRIGVSMVDDVARILSDFVKQYKADYGHLDEEQRPKVMFVVDSLGMLLTPTDVDQFQKGDMKGDLGRKAKSLTALVRNAVNQIAQWEIGLICTNHTYASQDMFDPDDKISGGQGFVYASSIVVAMRKLKLKEDADGNKVSDVRGIRAACKVMKSRYSKPFETVQLKIPYESGMDPYSGLFEMFESMGLLVKQGNRYRYVSPVTGEEIIEFRKNWTGKLLEQIMDEFDQHNINELNIEAKAQAATAAESAADTPTTPEEESVNEQ